jgi:hypothetical protein
MGGAIVKLKYIMEASGSGVTSEFKGEDFVGVDMSDYISSGYGVSRLDIKGCPNLKSFNGLTLPSSVKNINLSDIHNRISFDGIPNFLDYLLITNCEIESFEDLNHVDYLELRNVDLRGNLLSTIPDGVNNILLSSYENLSFNGIGDYSKKGIVVTNDSTVTMDFSGLTQLKVLSVSKIRLTTTNIKDLPKVTLNLKLNSLTFENVDAVRALTDKIRRSSPSYICLSFDNKMIGMFKENIMDFFEMVSACHEGVDQYGFLFGFDDSIDSNLSDIVNAMIKYTDIFDFQDWMIENGHEDLL